MLEREKGREKEALMWERNRWAAFRRCPPRNWTHAPPGHRMTLIQLSHAGQGLFFVFAPCHGFSLWGHSAWGWHPGIHISEPTFTFRRQRSCVPWGSWVPIPWVPSSGPESCGRGFSDADLCPGQESAWVHFWISWKAFHQPLIHGQMPIYRPQRAWLLSLSILF